MFICKKSSNISYEGHIIKLSIGQKCPIDTLIQLHPDLFEEILEKDEITQTEEKQIKEISEAIEQIPEISETPKISIKKIKEKIFRKN